jgi:hypothetical protein
LPGFATTDAAPIWFPVAASTRITVTSCVTSPPVVPAITMVPSVWKATSRAEVWSATALTWKNVLSSTVFPSAASRTSEKSPLAVPPMPTTTMRFWASTATASGLSELPASATSTVTRPVPALPNEVSIVPLGLNRATTKSPPAGVLDAMATNFPSCWTATSSKLRPVTPAV